MAEAVDVEATVIVLDIPAMDGHRPTTTTTIPAIRLHVVKLATTAFPIPIMEVVEVIWAVAVVAVVVVLLAMENKH